MRFIEKGPAPPAFMDWLDAANEDWQPGWEDLGGEVKRAAREALRLEQGDSCAYCGERLLRAVSAGQPDTILKVEHIEHLEPRERAPHRALDWSNLVLSCGGESEEPPPGHKHCGHAKKAWFEPAAFVGPTTPCCAGAFRYLANGAVVAGETVPDGFQDDAARQTIDRLNLDCARLRRRRSEAIQGWLESLDELADDELRRLVEGAGRPDADGALPEFSAALVSVLTELRVG